MKYRFVIDYTPTDPAGVASQRVCSPTYGDDLALSIEMESDEWYRKRKLEGKLTFLREDYGWIMGCAFDGTFKLTVQSSNDGGATWQPYLEGTFSRANLEIDEDNQNVVLNGLNEGGEYNAIENGKSEEYDLMKLIPDSEAKEVQGEVHPALALVDECSEVSKPTTSDIYCGAAFTSGGYNSDTELFWAEDKNMSARSTANLCTIIAEAKVQGGIYEGLYSGIVIYGTAQKQWIDNVQREYTVYITSPGGLLSNSDNTKFLRFGLYCDRDTNNRHAYIRFYLDNMLVETKQIRDMYMDNPYYSPMSFSVDGGYIQIRLHYIYASLLTQAIPLIAFLPRINYLDTSSYYKGIRPFNNNDDGLVVIPSVRTVEQPNGHGLVPGTGEQGTVPQYFAPPYDSDQWIPLAEDNWNYGSMWYRITPSVANGLLDPSKVGSFRWVRCWTLGTCLDRLLKKITNNKVTFDQSEAGSEFLYAAVNPLTQGEPFEYLFTQKSNVMRPSVGGEGAARCIVRLDWFLEFLRNALNCYWWLEERNGGTYAFRVEHVEWFRRGGSYTGQMDAQFNLTEIKTRRNFLRNGDAAKRLNDQLHKYSYEMNGMTEKYLFSWQGDGGSDAFKGNPMWFKAGWVEKGTSESKEVDNIFADLSWLMLNAGSDTASSKNYDGLFVFSGYRAGQSDLWRENAPAISQYLPFYARTYLCLTIPVGQSVTVELYDESTGIAQPMKIYHGTGEEMVIVNDNPYNYAPPLLLRVNLGSGYANITIHRLHSTLGNVYNVPNVANRLGDGYLQNGVLAWPWLQCEFLHYDIPAQRWSYDSDDIDTATFETSGTVKLRKKQEVPLLPLPTKSDEEDLDKGVIGGLKDSQGQLQTGIVKSATINLGTRNATLTLMYDMIS